ncbi:hypothetical protein HaLaN_20408, partial [Haematococcus lacustris]
MGLSFAEVTGQQGRPGVAWFRAADYPGAAASLLDAVYPYDENSTFMQPWLDCYAAYSTTLDLGRVSKLV